MNTFLKYILEKRLEEGGDVADEVWNFEKHVGDILKTNFSNIDSVKVTDSDMYSDLIVSLKDGSKFLVEVKLLFNFATGYYTGSLAGYKGEFLFIYIPEDDLFLVESKLHTKMPLSFEVAENYINQFLLQLHYGSAILKGNITDKSKTYHIAFTKKSLTTLVKIDNKNNIVTLNVNKIILDDSITLESDSILYCLKHTMLSQNKVKKNINLMTIMKDGGLSNDAKANLLNRWYQEKGEKNEIPVDYIVTSVKDDRDKINIYKFKKSDDPLKVLEQSETAILNENTFDIDFYMYCNYNIDSGICSLTSRLHIRKDLEQGLIISK